MELNPPGMARRGHSCAAHGSVGAALLGAVGFKPSKYDFYPQNDREGRAISSQNAANEQQLPIKNLWPQTWRFPSIGRSVEKWQSWDEMSLRPATSTESKEEGVEALNPSSRRSTVPC